MSRDRFGFSTGALERGNYRAALDWINSRDICTVELSALRFDELKPLILSLDSLKLNAFNYVSFHAPSSYIEEQEGEVIASLRHVAERGWNIIVHPDVIYTPSRWVEFGRLLLIENMDRRKNTGRTVEELNRLFCYLPEARMCLDVAHARQLDTTLTLLWNLSRTFRSRIAEIHISELDSRCRHRPLSVGAIADYRSIAASFLDVPVIIESMLDGMSKALRDEELILACDAWKLPKHDRKASRRVVTKADAGIAKV